MFPQFPDVPEAFLNVPGAGEKTSKHFTQYAETFFKKAEAFLKKFEGFSGVGQHQSHSAHCLDFDLRIIFKQLAKFVDKYVQAA